MIKRFYRWYKLPPASGTVVEVTKNYFSDDDEYINEEEGWVKIQDECISLEIEEEENER